MIVISHFSIDISNQSNEAIMINYYPVRLQFIVHFN